MIFIVHMALNSTHFFEVYLISPKSNRVAHPDSGLLGETLHDVYGVGGGGGVCMCVCV